MTSMYQTRCSSSSIAQQQRPAIKAAKAAAAAAAARAFGGRRCCLQVPASNSHSSSSSSSSRSSIIAFSAYAVHADGGGGGVNRQQRQQRAARPAQQQQQRRHRQQQDNERHDGSTQQQQQPRPRKDSSSDSSSTSSSSGSKSEPMLVSAGTSLAAAAHELMARLDANGSAEIWSTGVASQVAAVGVLVTAQEALAARGGGLAATFALAPPDSSDPQKQTIRKLVTGVVPAPAPAPEEWPSAEGLRTSTGAVRGVPALAAALRDGLAGPAAGHALEARGEQGVNRALRAILALQAEVGEALAVWPWYGAVDDAAAAARGERRTVAGTVLLVRRMSREGEDEGEEDEA